MSHFKPSIQLIHPHPSIPHRGITPSRPHHVGLVGAVLALIGLRADRALGLTRRLDLRHHGDRAAALAQRTDLGPGGASGAGQWGRLLWVSEDWLGQTMSKHETAKRSTNIWNLETTSH